MPERWLHHVYSSILGVQWDWVCPKVIASCRRFKPQSSTLNQIIAWKLQFHLVDIYMFLSLLCNIWQISALIGLLEDGCCRSLQHYCIAGIIRRTELGNRSSSFARSLQETQFEFGRNSFLSHVDFFFEV